MDQKSLGAIDLGEATWEFTVHKQMVGIPKESGLANKFYNKIKGKKE